jgi:hypothetical protein
MHGFNLPLFLGVRPASNLAPFLKAQTAANVGALLTRRVGSIRGMRNLFQPTPAQKFSANGLVAMATGGNEAPLRALLKNLANRAKRQEPWPDSLAPEDPGVQNFENPSIPSGYTYLLQLMAHDIVESAVSLASTGAEGFGFANTRLSPLSLETIYGGGPSVCPHAYEFDRAFRQNPGVVPRSRLRIGRSRTMAGSTDGCPFRDIARAIPAATKDDGLNPNEQLDLHVPDGHPWRTEALVADPRNDDHALLSQLTVLFHVLHNHLIGRLASPLSAPEDVLRHFICTRFVATLIYRAVVVKDVLEKILDPIVYRRYAKDQQPLLDELPQFGGPRDGIPLEFSHGAYRFGHAMVRDSYRVNSEEPLELGLALEQSSLRAPNNVPVNEKWLVDWSRFFKTATTNDLNLSRRIGPSYSPSLLDVTPFPPLSGADGSGLGNRDLLSAAYADLWSVPALCEELRSLLDINTIVPDFAVWRAPLREWLGRPPTTLSNDDINTLTDDPPLPFFIMFEAAHPIVNGVPTSLDGGRHLGPVGSIIIAETVFGALKRNAIGFEKAGATLREQIRATCDTVLGNGAAFDAVPEIESMPDLLQFMRAGGAITSPGPG